jgi:quercetin dioxygenase-like cupin family protein
LFPGRKFARRLDWLSKYPARRLPQAEAGGIVSAIVFADGGIVMRKSRQICGGTLFAGVALFAAALCAQQNGGDPAAHKVVRSGDLKSTPIIKGCDLAPVSGDVNADGGTFVIRIRCTDGTRIPAHWHPTDENVTILKGVFLVGMGDSFDESKLTPMNAGNFVSMPKQVRHFASSKGDTIVQVHGAGPFKVNWVNPSEVIPPDAPAAKAKS